MSSHTVREEDYHSVDAIRRFLDAHTNLLKDGTLRGICAAGVATGILLEFQKENRGSTPFWGQLNRLEMDLERIRQVFPQIMNKLHEYGEQGYDDALAYLGRAEISNIDFSRRDLPKDLISLIFAVGLSEGYHIVHDQKEWKK